MRDPEHELDALRDAGLLRELRPVTEVEPPFLHAGGRRLLNFSSNDYLGLSEHPEIIAASNKYLEMFGAGAGAAFVAINAIVHGLGNAVPAFQVAFLQQPVVPAPATAVQPADAGRLVVALATDSLLISGLQLQVSVEAMQATFAADAAFLVAAKRRRRIEFVKGVRPDNAGAQALRHPENLRAFVRPHAA